jgi:hypothetical protein
VVPEPDILDESFKFVAIEFIAPCVGPDREVHAFFKAASEFLDCRSFRMISPIKLPDNQEVPAEPPASGWLERSRIPFDADDEDSEDRAAYRGAWRTVWAEEEQWAEEEWMEEQWIEELWVEEQWVEPPRLEAYQTGGEEQFPEDPEEDEEQVEAEQAEEEEQLEAEQVEEEEQLEAEQVEGEEQFAEIQEEKEEEQLEADQAEGEEQGAENQAEGEEQLEADQAEEEEQLEEEQVEEEEQLEDEHVEEEQPRRRHRHRVSHLCI